MFNRRAALPVATVVALTFALFVTMFHAPSVAAQPNYSVTCLGSGPGLSDCRITLKTAVDLDSSFTVSVTNPNGVVIGCNTIPSGGQCTFTNSSVTFSCTAGCAAGSQYRDVVQLADGTADGQTLAISNTLAATPPYAGAVDIIDLSQPSTVTACTSTDTFIGITNGCFGITGLDCPSESIVGTPTNCSTSSQFCAAQTSGMYVNPCGVLAFSGGANSPLSVGVQAFQIGTPNTIAQSISANPSCLQTYITAAGTTQVQIC